MAKKFNANLDQRSLKNVLHVEFLPVTFYVLAGKGGLSYSYLAEKRLDVTRFKKWNDNKGGVHNQQGKLQDDLY